MKTKKAFLTRKPFYYFEKAIQFKLEILTVAGKTVGRKT